jgi:hypothetical protein
LLDALCAGEEAGKAAKNSLGIILERFSDLGLAIQSGLAYIYLISDKH